MEAGQSDQRCSQHRVNLARWQETLNVWGFRVCEKGARYKQHKLCLSQGEETLDVFNWGNRICSTVSILFTGHFLKLCVIGFGEILAELAVSLYNYLPLSFIHLLSENASSSAMFNELWWTIVKVVFGVKAMQFVQGVYCWGRRSFCLITHEPFSDRVNIVNGSLANDLQKGWEHSEEFKGQLSH